jgi:Spy/CpxP family protein refolding chaperone
MTKTVKLAFLASFVLNLLLLGVILGRVPSAFEGGSPREQRMEQALNNLPEPARTRIRDKFAQIRAAADPLREQMDRERAEALRLLSAEPFDEAAYDQQVSKIGDMRLQMFKQMAGAVKQAVKEFTPEERRMFADVLRRPSPTSR